MKKILSFLMLPLSVSALALNVASCKSYLYSENIWIVTDGGTIADKSFNEYAYIGSSMAAQTLYGSKETQDYVNKNNKLDLKSNIRASYFEQKAHKGADYTSAYKIARISSDWSGKKISFLVLAGYKHGPYINGSNGASGIFKPGYVVLLDSQADVQKHSKITKGLQPLAKGLENVVSVVYSAEVPAFDATLSTLISLNLHRNDPVLNIKDNTIKLSTFGGGDALTAVDNYMWGVIAATMFYKSWRNGNLDAKFNASLNKVIKDLKLPTNRKQDWYDVSLYKPLAEPFYSKNYDFSKIFSNTFNAGKGKDISKLNYQAGVNILMPVAGPQTLDAINVAKEQGLEKQVKILGVDSPQATVLNPNYKNNWVYTSAEKRIKITVRDIIKKFYDNQENKQADNNWYSKNINAQVADKTEKWQGVEYGNKNNKIIPLKTSTFMSLSKHLFNNHNFFGTKDTDSLNKFLATSFNSWAAKLPKQDFENFLKKIRTKTATKDNYLSTNNFIDWLNKY